MNLSFLRREVELFAAELWRGADDGRIREELEELLNELLLEVKRLVDVAGLDRKLLADALFNVEPVRDLLLKLQKIQNRSQGYYQAVTELLERLEALDSAQHQHGELEGSFRFELLIDGSLGKLLADSRVEDERLAQEVRVAATRRVEEMDEPTRLTLWERVLSELRPAPEGLFVEGILPDDFFKTTGVSTITEKIADYVVLYRPQIFLELARRKEERWYSPSVPGLGLLLASSAPMGVPAVDRRLMSALAEAYDGVSTETKDRLRLLFGLSDKAWIIVSEKHRQSKRELFGGSSGTTKATMSEASRLLGVIQRLLLHIESRVTLDTPLEQALLHHKLGLEVELPASRADLEKHTELALQKKLCRFLVERGIFAIGTKFGPSEVDLLVEHGGIPCVVEVKLFKEAPAPSRVRAALVQLQRYMEQQRLAARGILLLYNLSDVPIITDRRWIRGQYLVFAVNLPKKTPSGLRETLLVEEAVGDELISIIRPGSGTTRRSRARPRTGRARKKPEPR